MANLICDDCRRDDICDIVQVAAAFDAKECDKYEKEVVSPCDSCWPCICDDSCTYINPDAPEGKLFKI